VPAKTLVILNPHSAHGATGRRWAEIEPGLRDTLGELDVQRTLGRRDAERIADEAVQAGVQRLVVAGGDGTASEVVSGLLRSGRAEDAEVGLLPLGTGCDLPRTLGIPTAAGQAIRALGQGSTRRVDALRVTYRDRQGAERTAYSLNVTSFGLSGLTVELVTRAPHFFGGSFAFMVGALRSIIGYRCLGAKLIADGETLCDEPIVLAAAANGRYFGGGMQIAPDAAPDDGLLDLVIVRAMSKPSLIANFPSLYRGTHLSHERVSVCRAKRVEAVPASGELRPIWIDVDGEGLGTLPATVEVLPRAVTLFGVGAPATEKPS
jgi:diacylglycerol kinase (ATP)